MRLGCGNKGQPTAVPAHIEAQDLPPRDLPEHRAAVATDVEARQGHIDDQSHLVSGGYELLPESTSHGRASPLPLPRHQSWTMD
jgi:hypothetical protein